MTDRERIKQLEMELRTVREENARLKKIEEEWHALNRTLFVPGSLLTKLRDETARLQVELNAAASATGFLEENARLLEELKAAQARGNAPQESDVRAALDTAIAIICIRQCISCDKPTWWRDRNAGGAPRCPSCIMKANGNGLNVCPEALRRYLPDPVPASDSAALRNLAPEKAP